MTLPTYMLGVVVLEMACAHPRPASPAPPSPLDPAPAAEPAHPIGPAAAPSVDSSGVDPSTATNDAPQAMSPLSASPTHDALTWFVDVVTHRKGDVSRDEIARHCDKGFLGPVAGTSERFQHFAVEVSGAVLESIEVDDPTYIRAYIAMGRKRWQVIMQVEDSKISYLSYHRTR